PNREGDHSADYSPVVRSDIVKHIRRLRRRYRILILITHRPARMSVVRATHWDRVVLDLDDPLTALPWGRHPFMHLCLDQASEMCDLITANGLGIKDYFGGSLGREIVSLPNGIDSDYLERVRGFKTKRQGGSRPYRIVYTGVINQRMQYGILLNTVKRFSEICFVFVGPKRVPTEYEQEWLEIEKFPNVEIHPHVDHCELVRFIGESDALIIPYGTGNGTEFMLPAKVYEYVAWGKPIFCSRLYPEVSSVSGIFRVYDNESELCSLLKEEIARGFEVPDSIKKDCSDFLEMNTWDDRSVTLLELLGVS
ncbi:MAG TPA: glycosyltransferase, partial [Opitutales bacterium]|nr:glycosyltransferase [Opitutales bacterium]